jgi:putative RecB family exonuclease
VQSVFSPSSLGCFENCPKQYHFRYVEKLDVEGEGIEAFVGKRVHEVLERLYRFVADGMVPSLERVLYRYHQNFVAAFDAARIRITRDDVDAGSYRAAGARGLENYYRRHYPFDGDQTLGLEHPLQFALDEAGRYAVRGIIDRVVRAKDGVLEIHDYKTGRRVPRQHEVDRDRQLGLYELGLRKLWHERGPVRLVWHYVLSDQQRLSERSEEQRAELSEETTRTIDRIRAESAWEPRPSGLCGWCDYRALCPAFAAERPRLAATASEPPPLRADADGQLPLL